MVTVMLVVGWLVVTDGSGGVDAETVFGDGTTEEKEKCSRVQKKFGEEKRDDCSHTSDECCAF